MAQKYRTTRGQKPPLKLLHHKLALDAIKGAHGITRFDRPQAMTTLMAEGVELHTASTLFGYLVNNGYIEEIPHGR